MRAGNYTVANIRDKKYSFFVPRYQRLFSWEKEHCEQFAGDIFEDEEIDSKASSDGYFIGTFILKSDRADESLNLYEVIDGQQRLIAISLLLAALYKIIDDLKKEYENIVSTNLLIRLGIRLGMVEEEIEEFLVRKVSDEKYEPRFTASEYENNNLNFKKILQDCNLKINFKTEKNFRYSLMTTSFKYYKNFLSDRIKDLSPDLSPEGSIKAIEDISRSLKKISFIIIKVKSQDNACQLFASFNDRGKPLVAMDIIKNMFFDKIEKKQEAFLFDKWNNLIENLRTDTDKTKGKNLGASQHSDRYLRHFYNAFNKEDNKMFIIKSPISKKKLITVYKDLIDAKDNAKEKILPMVLVTNLCDKSKIYNAIIDPQKYKFEEKMNVPAQAFEIKDEKRKEAVVQGLKDLDEAKGAPANVLLLYLFSKFSQKRNDFENNEKTIQEIVNFLVKFFVRRNILQFPRTNIMDPLMDKIIEECEKSLKATDETSSKKIESKKIEKFMINFSGIYDKKIFRDKLIEFEASSPFDRVLAKLILTRVSNFHGEEEKKNPFFNFSEYKLEHIFPQKPLPLWVKEFNLGTEVKKEDREEFCKKWLHRLGNLTLTNSVGDPTLSNSSFVDKRNKDIFGYRNTQFWLDGNADNSSLIFTVNNETHMLATSPTWNKSFVEARSKALATHIANFYQFRSEERD